MNTLLKNFQNQISTEEYESGLINRSYDESQGNQDLEESPEEEEESVSSSEDSTEEDSSEDSTVDTSDSEEDSSPDDEEIRSQNEEDSARDRDFSDDVDSIEESSKDLSSMEAYVEFLEEAALKEGIDPNGAFLYNLAIESIYDSVGQPIEERTYLSCEAFNGLEDRKSNTFIALEDQKSKLGKWLNAVIKWIVDMVGRIASSLNGLGTNNKKLLKKFNSLGGNLSRIPKNDSTQNLEPASLSFDMADTEIGLNYRACPTVAEGILNMEKFWIAVMGKDGGKQYRFTEKYLDENTKAAKELADKVVKKYGVTGGYKEVQEKYASLSKGKKAWLRKWSSILNGFVDDMWKPYADNGEWETTKDINVSQESFEAHFQLALEDFVNNSTTVISQEVDLGSMVGAVGAAWDQTKDQAGNAVHWAGQHANLHDIAHVAADHGGTAAAIATGALALGAVTMKFANANKTNRVLKALQKLGAIQSTAKSRMFSLTQYRVAYYPSKNKFTIPEDGVFIVVRWNFSKIASGKDITNDLTEAKRLERHFVSMNETFKDPNDDNILKGKPIKFSPKNKNSYDVLKSLIESAKRVLGSSFEKSLKDLETSANMAKNKIAAFQTSVGNNVSNMEGISEIMKNVKSIVAKLYAPMRKVMTYMLRQYTRAAQVCDYILSLMAKVAS